MKPERPTKAELYEALRPFARIAEVMGRKLPSQTTDELHTWQLVGGEASLRFSDCMRALELLEASK